jgi:hypothetical protein
VRSITVDDTSYYWDEYLLFNPYKGFRYLTSTTATGTTCRS